jgi:hypothetical protein
VIEVVVAWADQTLHVAHLDRSRVIAVGDACEGPVVYELPFEVLGRRRVDVVTVEDGEPVVHDGARRFRLEPGDPVVVRFGPFAITIALVPPPDRFARARTLAASGALLAVLASALLHAGVLGALGLSPPDLSSDGTSLDRATQAFLLQAEANRADRELSAPSPKDELSVEDAGGSVERGARHRGAEGAHGDRSKPTADLRFRVAALPETREQSIARARAAIDEGRYGALEALSRVFSRAESRLVAFDATADETIGPHRQEFLGRIVGDRDGDAFGYHGLGLVGPGVGGGGLLDGIGLDRLGLFGAGSGGSCDASCSSRGFAHGASFRGLAGHAADEPGERRRHRPSVIRPIEQGADVIGRIPPESIKRVIRANFPRLRACYDAGLRRDPGLHGSIRARFVVDATGAVESASSSGGTLGDPSVEGCVVGVFRSLSFPEPERGKVLVTYPIEFGSDLPS